MEVKAGYRQTEVGVIPEDWDAKTIGNDIDLLTGFPFPSMGYTKSGVRLLRGSNVKRGQTDWTDDITQYWPKISNDLIRFQLREADLVIAMDGSLVGRSYAQLRSDDLPALLLQRVARIRSTKKLDVSYLTAFIGSDRWIKYADSVKTVTAIPHISPADIRNFKIPVPPTIEEQRAIATALSDVDALITSLDKLIAKKRDIKQAAMQELLTGKRRLPGFSGEWPTTCLGELGNFSKGNGIKKDDVLTDGLPCIRYGEIYTQHNDYIRKFYSFISEDIAKGSQQIKKGDLLFAGSGETTEDIGKCVAYVDDNEAYAGGDIIILSPKKDNSMYLGYLINHPSVASQKAKMGQGEMVVHISGKNLAKLIVNLPSVEEQTAIATVLSDMDADLAALEQKRDKTKAIKQGMMQELLTGRIRLV
jgi:type I restriction enzyme S subunit